MNGEDHKNKQHNDEYLISPKISMQSQLNMLQEFSN